MIYLPHDEQISSYTQIVQYYSYDSLNRLSSVEDKLNNATTSFRQNYTYDRWGNRTINAAATTDNVNEAQFDIDDLPNTNRLYAPGDLALPAAQRRMQYDPAGNLTNDTYTGGGTRAYDAEGRMTQAQFISGQLQTAFYTYDADGRRVKRNMGAGGEAWQVYGMEGELLAEYAPNAAPTAPQREYGYRAGELLVTAEPGVGLAPTGDAVWFDDALPAGAVPFANGETWNWVTANPSAYSGASSHQSATAAGWHNHYFTSATQTLQVGAGERLYAYVYLEAGNVPAEIMLQWNDGTTWYNAYWGADHINWVGARTRVGDVPQVTGQWLRLEVPAGVLGLEGKTLQGMAFNLWGGRATWDKAGKSSEGVWFDDATPAGAILNGNGEGWSWVGANPAPHSGTLAHQSALAAGWHNHYFTAATETLAVGAGDTLFAYVYIDPASVPTEVMVQWNDGAT
jgi:YD repeat-containing protein